MSKQKKWIRPRHYLVRNVAYWVLHPYCKLKYGIKIKKFTQQGKRPYLILYNHQTAFDQFFVGCAFSGPVYYVASEDLFSKGWVSSLIRFIVAPIPIKKQATDIKAVMNCLRVASEGGTIAIAPEGNRTYSGKTEYMSPAIAPLAKKLGLPIAIFHIRGGYGVHPRWSDTLRKGKMQAYVHKVIEPEDVKKMSNDELFDVIQKELFIDEGCITGEFLSKKRAEYLERAMYVCPDCGLSTFLSVGNECSCQKCGKTIIYNTDKSLSSKNCEFPFKFVTQWYDYQCDFINSLDVTRLVDKPIYSDTANFSEIIIYKTRNLLLKDASVLLYGNKIVVGEREFLFDDISALSVVGRNKLNIYVGKQLFQLKSDKHFNALKYANIFYRYKNIVGGQPDGKFLGL